MSTTNIPKIAVIREVGMRDGLQSIATILPTGRKLAWLEKAHAAGQREIEVGSFVPAKLMPQLADTAEVLAHAKKLPGLFASALVPNLKGAERALGGNADLMVVPLSASHMTAFRDLTLRSRALVAVRTRPGQAGTLPQKIWPSCFRP